MNTSKSSRRLVSMMGATLVALSATTAMADQVLEYKLDMSDDGSTYEVWMKPSATPKPDISLTGQLTIKVPHGSAFKATDVTAAIDGADWIEASRVDAPKEDVKHDYISFSYIGLQGGGAQNYHWKKDEEKLILSFKNEGGCVNGVSVMAADDPFNVESNSANTNPGNQFTNLGWGAVGENNFKGTYGEPIVCK